MTGKINRVVRAVSALSIVVLALLLGGCKLAILNPQGIVAADETRLLIDATLIMLLIVAPSIALTLYFAWRYNTKRKAKYTPDWAHSNTLEVVWWGIPCAVVIVLASITWISTHKLDPYRPLQSKQQPLVIQAVALNWKWLFIYPKQGVASVNFVEFPANVPIEFQITSDAPMNSFQITQLAGQIYAMAGMRTQLHLMADHAGDYRGLSTNFSGDGFSGMHFIARASASQEQFQQWVNSVKQTPQQLSLDVYQQLMLDSENNPVTYYSTVKNGLFDLVVKKYMDPKLQALMPQQPARQLSSNQAGVHHAS